jgi:DNA-binding NtrC family response regulator
LTPHQVRVALLARDRRFVRVTSFLLQRADYAVEAVPTPRRLLELAESGGVDVAVVDSTDLLGETARVTAAIADVDPPVGVVVLVDERDPLRLEAVTVIPKWHPFERLCDAIDQAHEEAVARIEHRLGW